MARVFTIMEGLENMGAIKTGGQGSVYKGRRIGEIITAIKILPTPIYTETVDDKNYVAFLNEVEKLKKVNEDANPHVVKILNSGITETGNLPFIEMEFIEGPDLEELLQPPHEPLFTIKEVLKVADQLSSALAHCHKSDVRHGDVKSNNVKYNKKTGNYVLLDFGLAVMSDEQRRTSLRRAGAIEFMAPEQNDGKMLFETDIYSFGVVMFEILAGRVPFPLNDKGETGRNTVMIAHQETPPPDIMQLRRRLLPASWSEQKKDQELHVPAWLTTMVYKCLEKKPEDRFATGIHLHDHIWLNSIRTANGNELTNERISFLEDENRRLRLEREQLQQQLLQYKHSEVISKDASENNSLSKNTRIIDRGASAPSRSTRSFFNKYTFISLFVLLVVVLGVYFLSRGKKESGAPPTVKQSSSTATTTTTVTEPPAATGELQTAREFLNQGKVAEAFTIYSALVQKQVPEAMYMWAKLALQNKNQNLSCAEAFELLKKASDKGYAPAKRTLGFLYSFANDKDALQKANYFDRCTFSGNVAKGSALLMEATLQGDTSASRLLEMLDARY